MVAKRATSDEIEKLAKKKGMIRMIEWHNKSDPGDNFHLRKF